MRVDGPYLGTATDQAFRDSAGRARDLGFDAKWVIHPSQVEPINELFSPTAAEIRRAEQIVEALEQAAVGHRAGAVADGGEMLDKAVERIARQVLERARHAEGPYQQTLDHV